ncbi:endonuclease/exonuclease/phosphatase family protein [uncultured Roseobacter sp.]|uniref:endonuclease/exonuclease/phosphatase family protein n=1 Tax=uncultured Roseobacter sp. TaxID=114847 RepID=UPI002605A72F|nr:endonuclease/exonuclease/phosphatase family protein [uncultured Roseobacter sp.]
MTETVIRIASYNIRKARGLDQKRCPERTLKVINQLDADIVVLQEADRRMGMRKPAIPRALIAAETDFTIAEASTNGVSLGWHGNAVLVRDATKVLNVARLSFPGLEPRGAVRVDLDVGSGVSMIAAHLGLRRRDRRAQLGTLCDASRDCAHTVIAGDFNEWSHRRGLEPLQGRFDTYAPGRTFHARRPLAALDRIALSKGIELRDAGVEQGDLARRASDHLPIWSDIAVPSAAATC